MYLISLLFFIAVLMYNFILANASALCIFDTVSILLVPLTLIPILVASGMEKDLLRALRFAVRRSLSLSSKQLKRCEEAVSLSMHILMYSGVLLFLIQCVIIRSLVVPSDNSLYILTTNLAVAMLSVIYPLFLCCLLLPIRSKLRGRMIDINTEDTPL